MAWIISLPGPVRLAVAFLLILLLPVGFLGLCALAVRQAAGAARSAPLTSALAAGVTLCLLIALALRRSPETLAWSLAAALALSAVPFALDRVERRGAAPHAPSLLPLAWRLPCSFPSSSSGSASWKKRCRSPFHISISSRRTEGENTKRPLHSERAFL